MKKPISLWYITGSRLPNRFANSYQIMKTCEALSAEGVSVTLVAPVKKDADREVITTDYAVSTPFSLILLKKRYNHLIYSFKLLSLLWKNRADDLLLYIRETPFVFVVLCARIIWGVPYVYESHRYASRSFYDGCRRRLIEMWAAGIVSISKTLDAKYENKKVPRAVAFCGTDPKRFDITAVSNQISDLKGKNIVMYIGSFQKKEGLSILFDAWNNIHDKKEWMLVVVGGNESEVANMKNMAPASTFFTGQVSKEQVPMYQQRADVLVLPFINTDEGGSPVKMFEYLYAGKAIVASDTEPIAEVLRNDENALLFETGKSKALRVALEKVMHDEVVRVRLGRQAASEASQYSFTERAKHIVSLLEVI